MKAKQNEHIFVICAYGESAYLEQCIRSLKAQTVSSEIIMSTSTPNEWIQSMSKKYKIPLYVSHSESGIAQDWNFALEQCKGRRYATIAHQDDTYEPNYTKYILTMTRKAHKPIIVFSDYGEIRKGKIVDDSKLVQVKRRMLFLLRFRCAQKSRFWRRRILGIGNAICCPSVTYNLTYLRQPIFQVGLKSNLDWETWERLSRYQGEFIYVPQILMHHRIHEASTTSELIRDNKRGREDYEIFKKFWPKWMAKVLTKLYSSSEKYNE